MHRSLPKKPPASRTTSHQTPNHSSKSTHSHQLQRKKINRFATRATTVTRAVNKSQKRSLSSVAAQSPHLHTENKRFLASTDDNDPLFVLTTVPILSSIPHLDPQSNPDLSPKIITTDNQTELPNGDKTATHHRQVFIQHDQKNKFATKFHASTAPSFSYTIPDDPQERQKQLDQRAQRTYIQYQPNIPTRVEQNSTREIEADESYILPVIRVGPTSFALMQLCNSSSRSSHLRMLGGTVSNPLSRSSIENASIVVDAQTNSLWQRILHNLSSRPVDVSRKNSEVYEMLKQMATVNRPIDTVNNEIIQYDPSFLDIRYSSQSAQLNTAYTDRTPPHGVKRKTFYQPTTRSQPNTVGRIIATQISTTPYPIDQPTHIPYGFTALTELSQKDITVPYPSNGVVQPWDEDSTAIQRQKQQQLLPSLVKKQTNKSMVHIMDFGQILPPTEINAEGMAISTNPNLFNPAQIPNLPGQLVYPNLFSHLSAPPEIQTLAAVLYSGSSQQLQDVTNAVIKTHLSQRYPKETPISIKTASAPYQSSLAPFLATVRSLVSPQRDIPPDLTSDKLGQFLVESHSKRNSSIFDTIFSPKYSHLESTDPRLLLWMIPLLYHWDKPGISHLSHPSSHGGHFEYNAFEPNQRPLTAVQASSLHWVPLNEITNVDSLLSPRFNQNKQVSTHIPALHRSLTLSQHFDLISQKYSKTRPDIVTAAQSWFEHIVKIPRLDREVLAKVSGATLNSPAINEFGQMLTTSTGSIFPTRQSHLNLLQTPEMISYLNAMIKTGRSEAFSTIPGGESKITKRFTKYPQIARHFGYDNNELLAFIQGSNKS